MPREQYESVRQFARRLGVHHSSVQNAVRVGRIVLAKNGKVPVERALAQWTARTDPRPPRSSYRNGKGPSDANTQVADSLIRSRAAREAFRAKREEIELAIKTGELIPRSMMIAEAFECARRARNQLLSIPARLAPILAAMSDPLEVSAALEEELDRVCEELSQGTSPES